MRREDRTKRTHGSLWKLDPQLVHHDVALGKTGTVDFILASRAKLERVATDRLRGTHVEWEENENDVAVHVAEQVGDRRFAVHVGAIVARPEVQPLALVGHEMKRLLGPILRDLDRLLDEHL